jgi:hypothetical protein
MTTTVDLPQASTSNNSKRLERGEDFLAGDNNTHYCDYHNNTAPKLHDDVPSITQASFVSNESNILQNLAKIRMHTRRP